MTTETADIAQLQKSLDANRRLLEKQISYQETMVRFAAAPMFNEMHEILDPIQLGLKETLKAISKEGLSFSRFGDGEMMLLMKTEFSIKFQRNSPALQKALKDALEYGAENQDKILIGYPHIFHNMHWTGIFSDVWPTMKKYATKFGRLGDSHVSRPLAFHAYGEEICDLWSSIWNGSKVVVVAGRGSRFSMEESLFGSVKETIEVFSTPENAFSDIPNIIRDVQHHSPDKVVIALGPAGSILAVELSKLGIQALDIGHLSASYKNVIEGAGFPEDTPHQQ